MHSLTGPNVHKHSPIYEEANFETLEPKASIGQLPSDRADFLSREVSVRQTLFDSYKLLYIISST